MIPKTKNDESNTFCLFLKKRNNSCGSWLMQPDYWRNTLFFFFISISINTFSQWSPDSIFKKEKLVEDILALKKTIEEVHPNPYGFCTEAVFDTAFSHAISTLNEKRSLADFTNIIATTIQVMKDSHTCVDYDYLREMQLKNGKYFLPLGLVSLVDGLYLAKDRDERIPVGAQLLCINDTDVGEIYETALQYACVEGDAHGAQRAIADAVFPVVLGLMVPIGDTAILDIRRNAIDPVEQISYPTYHQKQWQERSRRLAKLEFSETLKLETDPATRTAILKVGTFYPKNSAKYARFIFRSFRKIKKEKMRHVVIDIRENGGGSSTWVEYLYSFIDTMGYNTPDNIIGKNSALAREKSRNMMSPFAQWITRHFYKRNEDVQNFMTLLHLPDGASDTLYFYDPMVQRKSVVYQGDCYLLINGLTASASVDFTHVFRRRNRGAIVGEPCLGPMTGTWGNPAPYTLPNSKVKVNIATIRYNYDRSFRYDAQPIQPDYLIMPKREDLLEKRDTQLEFIKKIIRSKETGVPFSHQ